MLATALVAIGCGDDDESGDAGATGTTGAQTETSEALSPIDASFELEDAVADVNVATDQFGTDVNAAIEADDLAGVNAAGSAYVDARSEFGETLETTAFPASVQSDVDELIAANEEVLAEANRVAEAADIPASVSAVQSAVSLAADTSAAANEFAAELILLDE